MHIPCPYGYDGTEAERLDRAAEQAVKDGDYEHAKQLRHRAQAARRRAREEGAGVTSPWR